MKIKSARAVFVILLLFVSTTNQPALAAVSGQIIQDPQHPARMIYNGVTVDGHPKAAVLCGPGDPEDFFYINTQGNIDLLVNRGARTNYITAYLRDRCTSNNCNPGTGSALDTTLNQWETYLTQMENAGITTVFFFYDDGYGLPSGWETAVDAIVNKLKQHKLLIWSVAEEYSEGLSQSQVSQVADRIKAADTNSHVVGVHQLPGTAFNFNGDADLKMFLMQINVGSSEVNLMHANVITAWNNTQGQKILNMAEDIDHAFDSRTVVRQRNWAAIMGGASMVQVHEMGRATNPADTNDPNKYADCTRLMDFMESTTVNFMVPHDELKSGGTQWVLADPGNSYIGYATNLTGNMGFKNLVASAIYNLKWFDPVSGTLVSETKTAASTDTSWAKPAGIGSEVALFVNKTTGGPVATPSPTPSLFPSPTQANQPPQAQNTTVTAVTGNPIYIQLNYTDADGPGPYAYTITQNPAHGTLSGENNDRNYVAFPEFTGIDIVKWKVNDGLTDSNVATITINVLPYQSPDVDNNGIINSADMKMLIGNYALSGSSGFIRSDIDLSGKVNMLDVAVVYKNI